MVKLLEIITKKFHLLKDTSKYNVYIKGVQIIEIKVLKDCFDRSVSPER